MPSSGTSARCGIRATTGSAPAHSTAPAGVAHALGQLLHTLVLTGVPRRIVMGGGVMVGTSHLFPRVRAAMTASLGGYIGLSEVSLTDSYVVPPALGGNAGPLGAIVLGRQALEQPRPFTPA